MDWSKLTEQISKIRVKNVVDMPLKYGCIILILATISCFSSATITITNYLFEFALIPFALSAFGYFFFSIKNPDYLRSEEYHIKKQSLEILGDKENLLPVEGQNIVDISNPYTNQLEEGNNEKES